MKNKKRKKVHLGEMPKRMLLLTLPLILLGLLELLFLLDGMDTYEFVSHSVLVRSLLENIGVSLLLSFSGCFLLDLLEKKEHPSES